jgi:hypothetical protein
MTQMPLDRFDTGPNGGDRCDVCKQEVLSEFVVSTADWQKVTGNVPDEDGYAPGYWCLPCFLKAAEKLPDADYNIKLGTRVDYCKQLLNRKG